VFWTISVPRSSLDVNLGAGWALTTPIFDDQDLKRLLTKVFPSGFPQDAEVTFDVEWSGILDRQHIHNDAEDFEGDFLPTCPTWRLVGR
jgi:hypothetical protein